MSTEGKDSIVSLLVRGSGGCCGKEPLTMTGPESTGGRVESVRSLRGSGFVPWGKATFVE